MVLHGVIPFLYIHVLAYYYFTVTVLNFRFAVLFCIFIRFPAVACRVSFYIMYSRRVLLLRVVLYNYAKQ